MIEEYTIEIYHHDHDEYKYTARFDTYDGATDGDICYGVGDTHYEAIADLIENYKHFTG